MAKRFKRRRDGRVVAHLDEHEITLLARLFADVSTLLEPDGDAVSTPEWAVGLGLDGLGDDRAVEAPDDSALARLLPDAHRDDPGASAEFRRLTERALRERKRTALETSVTLLVGWAGGGSQTMDLDQARALAASLTDVRLVLADRLGVRTEADAEALHEREPDDEDLGDPAAWLAMVYEFTTWVQESLSGVLLDALPREGDGRRAAPDLGT